VVCAAEPAGQNTGTYQERREVLMAKKRVCVIKGDDAAPEVVIPTVRLLERMQLGIEFVGLTTGEEAIRQCGEGFPPAAKQAVDESDCTLFGSARDPRTTGLAYLRWGRKTYANFRPAKWMPGMRSPLKRPDGIDFVIVRENLEGLYPGREGDLARLEPLQLTDPMTLQVLDTSRKGKFAVRVITEENTRNIARAGCELAMKRKATGGKGKVTVVAKYNVLVQSDGLFRQVVEAIPRAQFRPAPRRQLLPADGPQPPPVRCRDHAQRERRCLLRWRGGPGGGLGPGPQRLSGRRLRLLRAGPRDGAGSGREELHQPHRHAAIREVDARLPGL
jgi:isocitrate dehydrogenase